MACSCVCNVTVSVGLIIIIVGSSTFYGLNGVEKFVEKVIAKFVELSTESPGYEEWKVPTAPSYKQFWVYNVTNPTEILNGTTPHLKEVGPFTYQLQQPRTDVEFYNNGTVSYRNKPLLVYKKAMSAFDSCVYVTQLNIPLIKAQALTKSPRTFASGDSLPLAEVLSNPKIFVNLTVQELLFGYNDSVSQSVKLFPSANAYFPDQFGLFLGLDDSASVLYLANDGSSNFKQSRLIEKWNGKNSLSWWSSSQANMINGTDGTYMNPKVGSNQILYFFNTDLCRSVYLTYEKQTEVRGVKTLRFRMSKNVFAKASVNSNNAGFCVPTRNCFDSGVLSVSSCKNNTPIIVSQPHFYQAAEKYMNGVKSKKPSKEHDETYFDIESFHGTVFSAMKRTQINVHVKNQDVLPQMKRMKKVMFSVVCQNETVNIDEATAKIYKEKAIIRKVVNIVPGVLLCVAILLLLLLIVITLKGRSCYTTI